MMEIFLLTLCLIFITNIELFKLKIVFSFRLALEINLYFSLHRKIFLITLLHVSFNILNVLFSCCIFYTVFC